MPGMPLDDFASTDGWMAVASGQAELRLMHDADSEGEALRMDFDFHSGGGFVVARKKFPFPMPEEFTLGFRVRGVCPQNHFEFKLEDAGGQNVWRWRQENFNFPKQWKEISLETEDVEFAWGPAGGGSIRQLGAIEFAIAAGSGGKGSVWISHLVLTDRGERPQPLVHASSSRSGHDSLLVMDGDRTTSWRSASQDTQPWLAIDFQEPRSLGGLVIQWEGREKDRGLELQTSDDASSWKTVHKSLRAEAARSYLPLPKTETRHLRLLFSQEMSRCGVTEITVEPVTFSRDADTFFHAVAAENPRGYYPRYWLREQSYWTPISHPDINGAALMNEEGMVEAGMGSFSLEAFLWSERRLLTWADAATTVGLQNDWLPVPSVSREFGQGLSMTTKSWMGVDETRGILHVTYEVRNTSPHTRHVRLFAAARPFQVTPPWQRFGQFGGVSAIRCIGWQENAIWVNGRAAVIPSMAPDAFGAATFEQGAITDFLAENILPEDQSIQDDSGWASGVMAFDLELPPGGSREIELLVPFTDSGHAKAVPEPAASSRSLAATVAIWGDKLGQWQIRLPETQMSVAHVLKTAVAHILGNRDGAALQPGPRRYTRSWIRDGAIMAAALLRAGCVQEALAYARWYAPFVREDGMVPCCVDHNGPDWLPEYDSQGQFIFLVAECHRFSNDDTFLRELWPSVQKSVQYIKTLRLQRLTPEFDTVEKIAYRGLLPESASHEGYLSHPVHSYWDDFWALRGLNNAMEMAQRLEEVADAQGMTELRDDLSSAVGASLREVVSRRGLDYVPGSVELADFDPTATANAVTLLGRLPEVSPELIGQTFSKYLESFRAKRCGALPWSSYSPYEIRIIGALARLGRRPEAFELLEFFLADRRPLPWNQWPEIAYRDPRSPGHIGDLPHTWISAEFVLAMHELFGPQSNTLIDS